jgi:ribokinase
MSGRVIVVGSSNTDLVTYCSHLPRAGETVLGGDLRTFAGGKGANQAVAAARAGVQVHFIGAFGDDAFGAARQADLEREGIDCSRCVVKKGVASGVALIAIGEGTGRARAENQIIVAPGANARLTPADVKRGLPKALGSCDVLIVSLEVPLNSILHAMRVVRTCGGTVILNPAPFPSKGLPLRMLACADFITPNETEFEQLCGVSVGDRRAVARVTALGDSSCSRRPEVLVTRGSKGVDRYRPAFGQRGHLPHAYEPGFARAPRVRAVDTVGAGDCFNGSLAARLAEETQDVQTAARYAVAAAALKVTRHGAQAGMPRRAEVLRSLSGRG